MTPISTARIKAPVSGAPCLWGAVTYTLASTVTSCKIIIKFITALKATYWSYHQQAYFVFLQHGFSCNAWETETAI